MRYRWLVSVLVSCTTTPTETTSAEGASPTDIFGTYAVTGSFAQLDVACATTPTTPVAGMCAEITVAPVGDAEFDTVTGCSFLDMNDSQISAGSNGGWFSEDTLATCTQNCGAGGSLPSEAARS